MSFIEKTTAEFQSLIADKNGKARFIRESAWEAFIERGLPTRHVENWRYTSLRSLDQLASQESENLQSIQEVLKTIPDSFNKVIIVDGVYQPDLSDFETPWLNDSRTAQINPDKHPMAVLNLALSQGGLNISIPAGIVLEKPIALIHLNTSQSSGKTHYLNHKITLGKGAKACVVPHYLSTSTASHSNNVLVLIDLQDNADLKYYSLNAENQESIQIEGIHVEQQKGSTLDVFTLSTGARVSRFDCTTAYLGTGAASTISGVYSVSQNQHTDIHLNAEHIAPHCTSKQSVRGVVDGSAKAVFNGRVCVHKNAIKSYSEQENHNLLLSKSAEVYTKPELEIYNDDVKCAHGATVGHIDQEALFYLMARGISKQDALDMLLLAFVEQQFDLIPDQSLKDYIRGYL